MKRKVSVAAAIALSPKDGKEQLMEALSPFLEEMKTNLEIEKDMSEGRAHFAKKEWNKAVPYFHKVIQSDSGIAEAWISLFACLVEMGEHDKAYTIGREGIKACPDSTELMFAVAKSEVDTNPNTALKYLQKILKLQPNNYYVLATLGGFHLAHNKPQEAAKYFAEAILLKPDCAKWWFEYGIACKGSEEPIKSLAAFEAAVALEPDNIKYAQWLLAHALDDCGSETFLNLAPSVIEGFPDDLSIQLFAGFIPALKDDNYEPLLAKCREPRGNDPLAFQLWRLQARILEETKYSEETIYSLKQAVAIMPNHKHCQFHLACKYYESGRYQEAFQVTNNQLSQGVTSPDIIALHAHTCLKLDKKKLAISTVEIGLEKNPKSCELFFSAVQLFVLYKDYERALKLNLRALELRPQDLELWGQRMAIFVALGRKKEAKDCVDQIQQLRDKS